MKIILVKIFGERKFFKTIEKAVEFIVNTFRDIIQEEVEDDHIYNLYDEEITDEEMYEREEESIKAEIEQAIEDFKTPIIKGIVGEEGYFSGYRKGRHIWVEVIDTDKLE